MSLAELAREVELVELRTTDVSARVRRGPMPVPGDTIDATFAVKAVAGRNGATDFDVFFSLDCRPRKSVGEREYARFLFRAVARYRAPRAWPDETIETFTRTNALIHLWPYARQYVQSASAQLSLLPILLPPYRVQVAERGAVTSTPVPPR
ncbi:MAG: hypothetical protein IAE78_01685 [Myxococcus sp.]|nr:hypothetical protein [Myxococcus sp.]